MASSLRLARGRALREGLRRGFTSSRLGREGGRKGEGGREKEGGREGGGREGRKRDRWIKI